MTPEHLAKMQAAGKAKREERAAAKAALPAKVKAKRPIGRKPNAVLSAYMKKKREAAPPTPTKKPDRGFMGWLDDFFAEPKK